jgi:hypothetical protein
MSTKAEQYARQIEAAVAEKTEAFSGERRYQASVKLEDAAAEYYRSNPSEVMLPATQTASVTIYDRLTGGSLWLVWRTVTEGGRRTTRFIVGDYSWTSTSKHHKIHSQRTIGSVLPTFLS